MSREWKPGEIALVEAGCWANRKVALRLAEGWSHENGVNVDGDGVISVVRPVVVIDPEDREAVERLHDAIFRHGDLGVVRDDLGYDETQAALREFADPKPPKPEEPMGTFSRVLDVEGNVWCRMPEGGWKRDNGNFVAHYDLIEGVVEVLS